MEITPDTTILWHWGMVKINATIVYTWLVMAALVIGSKLVTGNLRQGPEMARWQHVFEFLVSFIRNEIHQTIGKDSDRYVPLIASLFLFIGLSNLLDIVPGYQPPTGSLSTSTALALLVLVAVPFYGVKRLGLFAYLKNYAQPTIFMLPFNIVGELSRTLALAVRLFGNIMSGNMIAAILLIIAPLIVPILMQLLGMLTGVIQAYIFAILATVYIAAAVQAQEDSGGRKA